MSTQETAGARYEQRPPAQHDREAALVVPTIRGDLLARLDLSLSEGGLIQVSLSEAS